MLLKIAQVTILLTALFSFNALADPVFPAIFPSTEKRPNINGYYDRNMVWHAVAPGHDSAYYEALSPRPLVYYIANNRSGEDSSYLSTLSAGSRTRLHDIVAMPMMSSALSITRGSDGEWHYNYRLGGDLHLPIADTESPVDRLTLKAAVLRARPADFPVSVRPLITSFQAQVNTSGFNNLLLRESPCSRRPATERRPGINCTYDDDANMYSQERFTYFLRGFQHQADMSRNTPTYHTSTPPRRVRPCRSGAPPPNYQFSMTPFKKGDLDNICKTQVDNGVASGFQKVTLFFPVHYSGGNTPGNPYGRTARNMREGWDYRYEDADGISEGELHRCLEYINRAGLELNYVPHLESIVTMNATGESEWRIHGNIPVNNEYYDRAYGPLVHYLQDHPAQARGQKIRVAAAAELDPSFLGNTRASLDMTRRLRREMRATGAVPEISWMPNGDFHNGWHPMATANLDCSVMTDLLREVDRIAPSLYQEYGHIFNSHGSPERGANVSFNGTKEHFFAGMATKFRSLCPSQARNLDRIARSRKFSVGEFSLTDGSYSDFSTQMRAASGPESDATFWNSGGWDHAGISRPTTSPTHHAEIAATTSPCGSGGATVSPHAEPSASCPATRVDTLPTGSETEFMGDVRREIDP